MSMVLDALKRSRTEQQSDGVVPSVDADHYLEPQTRGLPTWVFVVGIALIVIILALAGLLLARGLNPLSKDSEAAPAAALVPSSTSPSTPSATSPSKLSVSSSSELPGAAVKEQVEEVRSAAAEATSSQAGIVTLQKKTQEEVVAEDPDPSVAALYQRARSPSNSMPDAALETPRAQAEGNTLPARNAETPAALATSDARVPTAAFRANPEEVAPVMEASTEEAVDIESVLRRAQAEMGESLLLPHPIPLLEALSQQQKDKIPTLMYSVHDYTTRGESAVVLNGARLKVGQQSKGFTVKEILEDSVIVSWGGTEFRLRALNSWINL